MGRKESHRTTACTSILRNGHVLTTAQQLEILQPYNAKDIKAVIFSIGSTKNPGPNGYGSEFFKAAWKIIGEDITKAIMEFFDNDKLLTQVNATIIALIPKTEMPQYASQYRPIFCCNVLYKCISKLICVRLRKALSLVVAENQAAFVEGRSLIHNVLICHDLLRHYNRKTSPRCLMKIDLKKAYDMISWDFLYEALQGYGFPEPFIQIVMRCVTSTKFTVKVNGEGHGYFQGRRGLRQGDPMSPLLFVLVMEYLTRLLGKMSEVHDFKFHPMCKASKLTHLIFADDLMIFCKELKIICLLYKESWKL